MNGYDFLAMLFGAVFVGTSVFIYFRIPVTIFDKNKSSITQMCGLNERLGKNVTEKKFSDVYALQIIGEHVSSSSSSGGSSSNYISFEVNLVMKDLVRLTIIDHANLDIIRAEATTIGTYLNVQVWDAT